MRTLLLPATAMVALLTSAVTAQVPASPLATTVAGIAQDPPKQGGEKDKGAKPAEQEKDKAGKAGEKEKGKEKDKGAEAGVEGAWITSYKDALARAKKEKKVVLADFTGSDWCGWCIKLKDEVFSKPEFQKWAKDNVVLLEVDFPKKKELPKDLKEQNDKLQKDFQIQGFPTILFLNAEGKKVGQMGYQEGGPEKWCKDADKLVKKAKNK